MNYANIIPHDVGNGPGIRVSLFVSGCTNNCPGCFNQDAKDFNYGNHFGNNTQSEILSYVKEPYVRGLSILGGDPMCQASLGKQMLTDLCNSVKKLGKDIWLWTGYTWEQMIDMCDVSPYTFGLLSSVDVVVDGPFIEAQKDLSLKWRGSANQRIIDVQQSLERGEVVLWETKTH